MYVCRSCVSVRAGIRAIPLPCSTMRSYHGRLDENGGLSHTEPSQSAVRPLSAFVRCRAAGTDDGGLPGLHGSKSNSTASALKNHEGVYHSSFSLLIPATSNRAPDFKGV